MPEQTIKEKMQGVWKEGNMNTTAKWYRWQTEDEPPFTTSKSELRKFCEQYSLNYEKVAEYFTKRGMIHNG